VGDKKPYVYRPMAPYVKLKQAEVAIEEANSLDEFKQVMGRFGTQIGYKAFCWLSMGKMTPEAMKPEEAIAVASECELKGDDEAAREIYERILVVHIDHPVAKSRLSDPTDRLLAEIFMSVESLPNSKKE
jgi:hypothetical protein